GFRGFGRSWSQLDLPRHLLHFTPATLRKLVEACGFAVDRVATPGHTKWMRMSVDRAAEHDPRWWVRACRVHLVRSALTRWTGWTGQGDELALLARPAAADPARADDSPQQRKKGPPAAGRVYKDKVTPHWFADETKFWYRNDLKGGAKEFVLVDAEKGTRGPVFDHAKLAASLSKATGKEYAASKLPFDDVTFVSENKAVRFKIAAAVWTCDLTTYECE